MLAASELDAFALKSTSEGLCSDQNSMLAAAQKNASALKHASADLLGDQGFVLTDPEQNIQAALHATAELVVGDRGSSLQMSIGNGLRLHEDAKQDHSQTEAAVEMVGQEWAQQMQIAKARVDENVCNKCGKTQLQVPEAKENSMKRMDKQVEIAMMTITDMMKRWSRAIILVRKRLAGEGLCTSYIKATLFTRMWGEAKQYRAVKRFWQSIQDKDSIQWDDLQLLPNYDVLPLQHNQKRIKQTRQQAVAAWKGWIGRVLQARQFAMRLRCKRAKDEGGDVYCEACFDAKACV